MKKLIPVIIALSFLLAGCNEDKPANSVETASFQNWVGKWTGPEGTFLDIEQNGEGYAITIQNLDGPRTFKDDVADNLLQFERDGVEETISAGDGAATGMKWLADKKDCLIVKEGEGYCRD